MTMTELRYMERVPYELKRIAEALETIAEALKNNEEKKVTNNGS